MASARAAFDDDGAPTKALEGFCRGQGVSPDDVERREDEKGVEYVYVHKKEIGNGAIEKNGIRPGEQCAGKSNAHSVVVIEGSLGSLHLKAGLLRQAKAICFNHSFSDFLVTDFCEIMP